MNGLSFDVILAIAMIILALWETVIAIQTKSKQRAIVVVAALVAAGVLLWLHGPEWWPR
jgi:hypothetical protein